MTRRELPGEDVVLVLNLGDPMIVRKPGSDGERCSSFAAGLSRGPSITETSGSQRGVQVDLTPIGARMLFGLPMDQLADRALDVGDVLGRLGEWMVDRMATSPAWEGRFELLDRVIGARLATTPGPAPATWRAWRRLRETGGTVRVDALARVLGMSRRHLAETFRRDVGVPPKTFARIVRFRAARSRLGDDPGSSLATVAAMSGYYDQSHLDREFRDLAGMTPTEYRARLLPDGGGLAES
jgi:AraC-like DNA-binding protein